MCELQHVAHLLPAVNQPLGTSLACGRVSLLLWDAGLPTGWRAAVSREHPAVGSLGAWQSGSSFGSEMKEIQERTENKKTS